MAVSMLLFALNVWRSRTHGAPAAAVSTLTEPLLSVPLSSYDPGAVMAIAPPETVTLLPETLRDFAGTVNTLDEAPTIFQAATLALYIQEKS